MTVEMQWVRLTAERVQFWQLSRTRFQISQLRDKRLHRWQAVPSTIASWETLLPDHSSPTAWTARKRTCCLLVNGVQSKRATDISGQNVTRMMHGLLCRLRSVAWGRRSTFRYIFRYNYFSRTPFWLVESWCIYRHFSNCISYVEGDGIARSV
jgi:hypothetical protein